MDLDAAFAITYAQIGMEYTFRRDFIVLLCVFVPSE